MAKKNISLAVGLAVAFLAMQTPHLTQANEGEREIINSTVVSARHRERQTLRNAVPVQSQAIRADNAEALASRGFLGPLFGRT